MRTRRPPKVVAFDSARFDEARARNKANMARFVMYCSRWIQLAGRVYKHESNYVRWIGRIWRIAKLKLVIPPWSIELNRTRKYWLIWRERRQYSARECQQRVEASRIDDVELRWDVDRTRQRFPPIQWTSCKESIRVFDGSVKMSDLRNQNLQQRRWLLL